MTVRYIRVSTPLEVLRRHKYIVGVRFPKKDRFNRVFHFAFDTGAEGAWFMDRETKEGAVIVEFAHPVNK